MASAARRLLRARVVLVVNWSICLCLGRSLARLSETETRIIQNHAQPSPLQLFRSSSPTGFCLCRFVAPLSLIYALAVSPVSRKYLFYRSLKSSLSRFLFTLSLHSLVSVPPGPENANLT
eukprot:6191947-Pleurochrysis_carterae.AAC.1